MSFQQYQLEDRRLSLLLILKESSAYTANEHLLRMVLESFGFYPSQDVLRSDLAWLQEQGLITLKEVADIHVATIKQRGKDVAEGRTTCPGIKKPEAGI